MGTKGCGKPQIQRFQISLRRYGSFNDLYVLHYLELLMIVEKKCNDECTYIIVRFVLKFTCITTGGTCLKMSILDSDTHSLQGSRLAIFFLSVGAFKQCMSEGCILIQKYFLFCILISLYFSCPKQSSLLHTIKKMFIYSRLFIN